MGAARKLQQEIDATMKKVKEGLGTFDEITDKLENVDEGHNQREKLVAQLKDQIKKLQKDRDKIKGWASDKDVRDKKLLLEARTWIERRMEKFKECEKDMKVKAFSKMGLEKGAKLDPRQAALEEQLSWLRETMDEFNQKVEMNEAEIESHLANLKRNKEPPAVVQELHDRNLLHKKHIERLEQVQRALDNEVISPEQVQEMHDDITDCLENIDADQDGAYEDVDAMYDEAVLELLDQVDVHVPVVDRVALRSSDVGDKGDKKAGRPEKTRADAREKEREKASVAAVRAQIVGKGAAPFPTGAPDVEKPAARAAKEPAPTPSQPQPAQPPLQPTQQPPPPPPRAAPAAASQAGAHTSQQSDSSAASVAAQKQAQAPWATGGPPVTQAAAPPVDRAPADGDALHLSSASAQGAQASTLSISDSSPQAGPGLPIASHDGSSGASAALPPDAPQPELLLRQRLLHPLDSIWARYTCARRQRTTRAPPSYPLLPPAVLETGAPYQSERDRGDEDLFLAFYLSPGTMFQYLAACELTRRGWRYHKTLKTWFQRTPDGWHDVGKDEERGEYMYFDCGFEDAANAWVHRIKSDYTIQYDQLEEEMTIPTS